MSNKLYDFLKDCSLIYIGAIGVFYLAIATIWNLPYGNEILATCTAISTLLGTCLKIESNSYTDGIVMDLPQFIDDEDGEFDE